MISELISNPWEFWFFRSGLANSVLIRNPQPQKLQEILVRRICVIK